MNERIRELAEQAREYASDYVADSKHYGYYMEHNELEIKFKEKFAELIVRECIDWCNANARDDGTAQRIAEDIKKDFGVKE
jgi:tRNA U38,U39,U40 pseudouridine synthase TruA